MVRMKDDRGRTEAILGSGPRDQSERFVAVLEIPPVVPAKTAVRVQIVKDVKAGRTKKR